MLGAPCQLRGRDNLGNAVIHCAGAAPKACHREVWRGPYSKRHDGGGSGGGGVFEGAGG